MLRNSRRVASRNNDKRSYGHTRFRKSDFAQVEMLRELAGLARMTLARQTNALSTLAA